MSIDMDPAAEPLTFHIGVITYLTKPDNDSGPQSPKWIQIWRVTAVVDYPTGNVTGLTAEMQSSFREEYEAICVSFQLRGKLAAYSLFYSYQQFGPFNHGHKIIIVNWETCNSSSLNYTRKIIADTQAKVSSTPLFDLLMQTKYSGWHQLPATDCFAMKMVVSCYMILPTPQPQRSPRNIRITLRPSRRLPPARLLPAQFPSLSFFKALPASLSSQGAA